MSDITQSSFIHVQIDANTNNKNNNMLCCSVMLYKSAFSVFAFYFTPSKIGCCFSKSSLQFMNWRTFPTAFTLLLFFLFLFLSLAIQIFHDSLLSFIQHVCWEFVVCLCPWLSANIIHIYKRHFIVATNVICSVFFYVSSHICMLVWLLFFHFKHIVFSLITKKGNNNNNASELRSGYDISQIGGDWKDGKLTEPVECTRSAEQGNEIKRERKKQPSCGQKHDIYESKPQTITTFISFIKFFIFLLCVLFPVVFSSLAPTSAPPPLSFSLFFPFVRFPNSFSTG